MPFVFLQRSSCSQNITHFQYHSRSFDIRNVSYKKYAISPDTSPLDYWSVCLVELKKNPQNYLTELVNIVERYATSLNKHQIVTAVADTLPRAQACVESDAPPSDSMQAWAVSRVSFTALTIYV